jgi:hypothetical protein
MAAASIKCLAGSIKRAARGHDYLSNADWVFSSPAPFQKLAPLGSIRAGFFRRGLKKRPPTGGQFWEGAAIRCGAPPRGPVSGFETRRPGRSPQDPFSSPRGRQAMIQVNRGPEVDY